MRKKAKHLRRETTKLQVNGFSMVRNYDDWIGGVMYCLNNGKTELKLSDSVINMAKSICEFCFYNYTRFHNRAVLSASCLYIASIICKEPRRQRDIADAIHVTEVSIRTHYMRIIKLNNIESVIGEIGEPSKFSEQRIKVQTAFERMMKGKDICQESSIRN